MSKKSGFHRQIWPKSVTHLHGITHTIHAAGELARNPSDTRRTRSQFESAFCMKYPLFAEKCYMMVESDP